MKLKNKVAIKINGQEYSIVGAESKEYLLKVGSFVDDKMGDISRANKKLSTSMIAVLTCINIADQYLKMENNLKELEKQLEQPQQAINELEKHIENLHRNLDERDEAYSNLEEKIEELEANQQVDEQVNLLKEELLQKEDDLEKAQILINDLQNRLFDNQIKLVQATSSLEEHRRKNGVSENNSPSV